MSSRIIYNPGTNIGRDVQQFVNTMQQALAQGRRLKAKLDAAAYGSPADYSAVAAELGLPDPGAVSSTAAQDAWTILETAIGQVDSAQVRELSRLDI